ncbi:response regulator [Bdellovibrio reynosensis]|uniref:histidine kinase n=1 Tax=Bdellovibrio reynosensis TaxID=2835041 RepID=A0ABY4C7V7_9BACT|nr:response regulator [Bdellovibrio reynosensis]UOF00874.1 response regulator [Bdellovibrio reynosensis]
MSNVDVLIVDDRIDGLIALEAVLNQPDITLVKAQSGQEALDLLDHYDFGLILLDVQMPGMDGFETASRIRQHPRYKLRPIIFVTAINKDDQYIYKGYEVGGVDYIFKPFEPQILRSKVQVFADLYRKAQRLREQTEIIRESERRERYLRLTELELESLKRYRNLANAIPHVVWRAKADGGMEYFNEFWSSYTGFSQEASVGSGWQLAMHHDDLKNFLKLWLGAMTEGCAFESECRIIDKDGNYRWFWIKAVAELNSAGQIMNWLGTCTDIHDRKMTEIRLVTAEREAKAANRAKTSFLANMSHEIRTPMNVILGFTELMLDSNQTHEKRTQCIHTVQRNAGHLLKIIDEILDISKVESGMMTIENIDVNFATLLSDTNALMQLPAKDRGIELKFNLRSPIPRFIKCDPTRLRQIMNNLIGNAIKFTPHGSVTISVEWLPDQGQNGRSLLHIHVIDTGVGIKPENVERLFKPFVQEDASTTRKFGGTGLGLSLSRELARALGGDIKLIASESGKGSHFMIEIETTSTKEAPFLENLEFNISSRGGKSIKMDNRLHGMKILLVEDVADNQALMLHFLNIAGADVEIASDGIEAIEKASSNYYDVILMDVQMPHIDGYEATRQLRDKGYDGLIIALTAHALPEEKDRSIEAGCDEHITKPIQFNELVELLLDLRSEMRFVGEERVH